MRRSKPITKSETVTDALERFKKVSTELTAICKDLESLDKYSKSTKFVRFEVTRVHVFPLYKKSDGGSLKGYASIELGGQLAMIGLRIIENDEGALDVKYPPNPFPTRDGETIMFTTSNELQEHIKYSVIETYMKATE